MSHFDNTRVIPASPEEVFAAFEDPSRLARWWGPDGFTNTFHVFEFRPGGEWRLTMHGPNGTDYPNGSEFVEIVPPSLVRIRHLSLPHFELAISLDAEGDGTRVTWKMTFEDAAFAENARDFLQNANEQNLDRLTRVVAG